MLNQKEIKRIKFLFNLNGYAVIKKFIPRKLVNKLQDEVLKLIKKGSIKKGVIKKRITRVSYYLKRPIVIH